MFKYIKNRINKQGCIYLRMNPYLLRIMKIYEGNILYLHSKVIYTSIYLRNVINGTE